MSRVVVVVSLLAEADAGHTEFLDEVYENESRFPGGEWKPAAESYTDVVNIMCVIIKLLHIQSVSV